MPRWFSIAAIFIVTAFVLHAFLVVVSLAAGVVSGSSLLPMAGPVTFLAEFGLAAVITWLIVRARPARVVLTPEQERQLDEDVEADARRRVRDIEKQYRDRQRLDVLKAEVAKWREARDLRAYALDALADLADGDAATADGSSLREELEWAIEYADSIDPVKSRLSQPAS